MTQTPDSPEPLINEPIWMKKFNLWSSMQKGCMAARGPNGVYCSWEGRSCGYNTCPRRIFEEVMMDPDAIQVPKPPPKMKNQIQSLQNENKQQQKQIEALTKRLEELEKLRANP